VPGHARMKNIYLEEFIEFKSVGMGLEKNILLKDLY